MTVHKGVGHHGAPITLDQAKKAMAAAEGRAKQKDWMSISIVDGGHMVMLQRTPPHGSDPRHVRSP